MAQHIEGLPNYASLVSALHESEGDVGRTRAGYDALLDAFPLCYGYWKRWDLVEEQRGDN